MKPSLFNIGFAAVLMAGVGLAVMPASAKDERLGTSGKWEAYRSGSGKDKVCFITSTPINMKANMIGTTAGQHVYSSPIITVILISVGLSAALQVIASRR